MTKDRATGLIAVVAGIVLMIYTKMLPPSMMAGDIGPAVFPYISSCILILCGTGLVVTGKKKEEKPYFTGPQLKRLGMISAVMILFIVAEALFGFIVPTIVVLFVLSRMFSNGKQVAAWKSLLFAVVLTAVLYYLFTNTFSMVLPRGIF